jgi:Uma2 family endonuclease
MLQPMVDPAAIEPEKIRGLMRVEYDKLVDLGVFEGEPIELLRGTLVTMSPQGRRHSEISNWLGQKLILLLGTMDYDVRFHSPYAASEDSEPEPDITVSLRTDHREHPSKPLLVVEVADSSIRKDRKLKAGIYAEAGAPEYWLVDISDEALQIEVRTQPTARGYRTMEILRDGDVLRPTTLPVEIAVADIPWTRS